MNVDVKREEKENEKKLKNEMSRFSVRIIINGHIIQSV